MVNSTGVEPAVEVQGLVVRRGKTEILHGLSCTLPAGSITGLFGPSGCGKTTLMRTIVGVQHITSGSVLVLDEPTVGLDPLTREGLWETFHSLAADGTTLLVSSHVMSEATRCHNALFMRHGLFLAHEPVKALQARTHTTTPEDAFLALIRTTGREER